MQPRSIYSITVSILAIMAFLAPDAHASNGEKMLPGHRMCTLRHYPVPNPQVTFDLIAVQINSTKQLSSESPWTVGYRVLKVFREHPNPSKHIPKTGSAIYCPIMNGACGTGYVGPSPPAVNSKVILLASKGYGSVIFIKCSLQPKSKSVNFMGMGSKAFPFNLKQQQRALDFVNSYAEERSKWESWLTKNKKKKA